MSCPRCNNENAFTSESAYQCKKCNIIRYPTWYKLLICDGGENYISWDIRDPFDLKSSRYICGITYISNGMFIHYKVIPYIPINATMDRIIRLLMLA